MKNYLKKLPKELKDLIYLAKDIAIANDMSAYLVGGCVRDLLLRVKNLDLDIVVEGDGISFAEDFAKKLEAKLIRHRRFGTATVTLGSGLKVDVATSRKELYPEPASLPQVSGGTLKDDLRRRDFTINAMAINISGRDFGSLIDLFNGKDDLRHKKIRVLHNLSFIDDPTRILRAIRFKERYNFKIESKTLGLLKEAVRIKMLDKVEPQRLRDELILILKEEDPIEQIKPIQELVGFSFITPKLYVSGKTYKLLKAIKNQIKGFRNVYPRRRQLDAWLIYFMGLTDSLRISDIKSVLKKFAFRKGQEKIILSSHKIDNRLIRQLSQDKIKPSKIFKIFEPLSYETIIFVKAKYENRYIKRHIEDFLKNYNTIRLGVSGKDILRLGINPGPDYQKILYKVLNAKLNGFVKTKEEELALIKRLVR